MALDAVRGLRIVAREMRRRGWEVVEVPGWETRGHGAVLVPRGEVNHWTAGPRTGDAPSLGVVTHGRPGLRNALCHTYSSRWPRLYIVAARVAWHAGAGSYGSLRGNLDCLGHEPECSGPGDWRPGQLELQADLSAVQSNVFGYPLAAVIDHFEWTSRKVDRRDVGGAPWRQRVLEVRAAGHPINPPATDPWEDWLMAVPERTRENIEALAGAIGPARLARLVRLTETDLPADTFEALAEADARTRTLVHLLNHYRRVADGVGVRRDDPVGVADALLSSATAAPDRLVRDLLRHEVARLRASVGLPPDPAADDLWVTRLAEGRADLATVARRLREAAQSR